MTLRARSCANTVMGWEITRQLHVIRQSILLIDVLRLIGSERGRRKGRKLNVIRERKRRLRKSWKLRKRRKKR